MFWVTISSNTNLHLTLIYLFSVLIYLWCFIFFFPLFHPDWFAFKVTTAKQCKATRDQSRTIEQWGGRRETFDWQRRDGMSRGQPYGLILLHWTPGGIIIIIIIWWKIVQSSARKACYYYDNEWHTKERQCYKRDDWRADTAFLSFITSHIYFWTGMFDYYGKREKERKERNSWHWFDCHTRCVMVGLVRSLFLIGCLCLSGIWQGSCLLRLDAI